MFIGWPIWREYWRKAASEPISKRPFRVRIPPMTATAA
jgi:hypothetical protein